MRLRQNRLKRYVPNCTGITATGRRCRRMAGSGTRHVRYGYCQSHGGSTPTVEATWEAAMRVAREDDISPWEALLKTTRLASNRVTWVDQQLAEAVAAEDGDQGSARVRGWLKESRAERTLLARTAKAAIDAGVAERLVRQVELEGRLVAEVLGRTLDALDLTAEQRQVAFATAHRELLQLEASDAGGE